MSKSLVTEQTVEHKRYDVKPAGDTLPPENSEMASIGDRVKKARSDLQMTQLQLAQRAGGEVSQRTISNLETNRNRSSRQLVAIAKALNVNPIWLESGRGPKEIGAPDLPNQQRSSSEGLIPIDRLLRKIPVVGAAQLGDGVAFVELEYPVGSGDGFVPFPSVDQRAYAVRCKGDSMYPRIQHGEFAVIEPSVEPQPGDEVLVKAVDGRVMIKRLKYIKDGRLHLESVNDGQHPSIVIDALDIEALHYVAGLVKSRMWRPD